MADLISVGLDVGTTTTQLILSQLKVENKASSFAVPEMAITDREILYRSEVIFTPLKNHHLVDGDAIARWVDGEYEKAGIERQQVDTGAIIITGETSRKENAEETLRALSDYAGDFVVATAGPDLESVLAAKGAGAVEASLAEDRPILHMDIGGGTSNLALIEKGRVVATGCLNVGGRLLKFDDDGKVSYVSSALEGLTDLQVGQVPTAAQLSVLANLLTKALEMAAGIAPATHLLEQLWTKECGPIWKIPTERPILSFSGGVADCIEKPLAGNTFGDIGPYLGQAIFQSDLCKDRYFLGKETIRATVIGAGCHSTQLSGSTVFYRNVSLPIKNVPVIAITEQEQASSALPGILREKRKMQDSETVIFALPGVPSANYDTVKTLARRLAEAAEGAPLYLSLAQDMAKAVGHCLCLQDPAPENLLCIDGLHLREGDFLDVGQPVGPALPVVIKTLILSKEG